MSKAAPQPQSNISFNLYDFDRAKGYRGVDDPMLRPLYEARVRTNLRISPKGKANFSSDFENNMGVVRLYNVANERDNPIFFSKSEFINGTAQTPFGHSEKTGMRALLNHYIKDR